MDILYKLAQTMDASLHTHPKLILPDGIFHVKDMIHLLYLIINSQNKLEAFCEFNVQDRGLSMVKVQ